VASQNARMSIGELERLMLESRSKLVDLVLMLSRGGQVGSTREREKKGKTTSLNMFGRLGGEGNRLY